MKQTAIECIIEKIQKRIDRQSSYIEKYNTPDCRLYLYKILEECMEALEMEKEQIIRSHIHGQETEKDYWCIGDKMGVRPRIDSEKYYNETYKTD